MNLLFVTRQLGLVLLVLSLSLLAVGGWSAAQAMTGVSAETEAAKALVVTVVFGAILGCVLWWSGRGGPVQLGRREAMLLVATSWLLGAGLAAVPYFIWACLTHDAHPGHPFANPIDCYFEAMSGLTTTGATVLGHDGHMIEQLPRGLLLWRSLTQWLGGLGIVVLFVAVLPTLGVGGKRLFRVESPGPAAPGVRPRIGQTARALWLIYLTLTLVEVLALWLAGASFFDALCHTFTTLATGGFSTRDSSAGGESPAIQIILIVFMILGGINFGLYYHLTRGRFRQVWTNTELRFYIGLLAVATMIVVITILNRPLATTAAPNQPVKAAAGQALLHGAFQVVSIQTGTGFCTANFDTWGFTADAVFLALMFVGASAGSTGGGIKVIRILIMVKVFIAELERAFRPNVVRTVKVGNAVVNLDHRISTLVYILGIVVLFIVGAVLLMWFESSADCTFRTAATASAATLNNIGPGLGRVGAIENYGWFSGPSKVLLSLLMVLGRLELFAILVLLSPRFWRGE